MDDEKKHRGVLVASLPPVVYSIFENLPVKQLNTCAQVCKMWRSIANSIKKRKKRISCFYYYYCHGGGSASPCFPLCNDKSSNGLNAFKKNLSELQCEPSLALMFCSEFMGPTLKCFFPPLRTRKRKITCADNSHRGMEIDFPYLPKNCDVGFCTIFGTAGLCPENSEPKEVALCPSYSVLYLPTFPGVDIYKFPITSIQSISSISCSEYTGIPEHAQVKCMLVFLNARCRNFHDSVFFDIIISEYLIKQDWKMALGGTFVENMFFPKHRLGENNQCCGIAFAGENIEAASITISEDMETETKIIQELEVLKKTDFLKGQCFAFMFTCLERTGFFSNHRKESLIFRKLFPGVPLIGLFGNQCQIGVNYVPNLKCEEHKESDSWFKKYGLVFVLISVKS